LNANTYIPVRADIRNVIHSIWQIERDRSVTSEQIIPKGVIEIIFNFSGDTIPFKVGKNNHTIPYCFINGFNRTPINLQFNNHQTFFGVRLQPLAIRKILGIPAKEFCDIAVDLCLIDKRFRALWQRMAETASFHKRVAIVCEWVSKQLIELQPREQFMNDFLCAQDQHQLTVTQLASNLCYSTRQLTRKVLEVTGMNTEEILLYKKYLHAIHLIHDPAFSLTDIAYDSGFSDQSHFIRVFRSLAHMTPGEYRKKKSFVEGHILQNVR